MAKPWAVTLIFKTDEAMGTSDVYDMLSGVLEQVLVEPWAIEIKPLQEVADVRDPAGAV